MASFNILLVDDNQSNRLVGKALLTRLGHNVVLAESGQQALDMLETGTYDVVLMDIDMPGMDGVQATRIIREREMGGDGRRMPIIALTALAMEKDKVRVLEAGMDAHVSKPFDAKNLVAVIEQVVASTEKESRSSPAQGDPQTALRARILENIGGSEDLLRTLAGIFQEEAPQAMAEIRAAVETDDPKRAGHAAHKLRGSAGVLEAQRIVELTTEIEYRNEPHDHERLQRLADELDRELMEFGRLLQGMTA